MAFNGDEGSVITLQEGIDLTTAYRNSAMNDIKGVFVGRQLLEQMLNQPESKGIRFYFGLNSSEKLTLVLVAADADGKDLTDMVGDRGVPCPSSCDLDSPLSS